MKEKTASVSSEEIQISFEESKRRLINQKLVDTFNRQATRENKPIVSREWYERLFRSLPTGYDPLDDSEGNQIHLLLDPWENFPSFESVLYCDLDYDIVLLSILWFYFFDHFTGNPMLSIALTFVIERILKYIRQWLGEKNLAKKTLVNQAFLT